MLKAPPTIGQRSPTRTKAQDPNGTRAILSSRKYRTWRARIALQRMNRCDVCYHRDGRTIDYAEAHHIKPRSTHPELVMDADNLLLLCREHHEEQHSTGVDLDLLFDCIAICGAPCSGKSTYARTVARPDDVVWDWDVAGQSLGLTRNDDVSPPDWQRLMDMRRETVRDAQYAHNRLWLISSYAGTRLVREAARDVVTMRTTHNVCHARLKRRVVDESLTDVEAARIAKAIDTWFEAH